MHGLGRNFGGYTETPGNLKEQLCGRLASAADVTFAPDVAEFSHEEKSTSTTFILLLVPAIIFLSMIMLASCSLKRTAIRCFAKLHAIKRKQT